MMQSDTASRDQLLNYEEGSVMYNPCGKPLETLTEPKQERLVFLNNKWMLEDDMTDQRTFDEQREQIENTYRLVGKILSSPEALQGSMLTASRFDEKSKRVSNIVQSSPVIYGFAIGIPGFVISVIILLIMSTGEDGSDQRKMSIYLIIPIVLFTFISVLPMMFHLLLPACTGTLLLQKKLVSLIQYLPLCEISREEFQSVFTEADHGVIDYKIVGSAGDGFGFYASQGSNRELISKDTVLTQDIDINIFLNSLKLKKRNIQPIPGGKGFVWIQISEQEFSELSDPVMRNCLQPISGGSGYYLSSAGIAQQAVRYFTEHSSGSQDAEIVEHFPALTLQTKTEGPNGVQKFEVDYAFALRYPLWPDEAAEWITRERPGIPQDVIDEISSRGCYLVHKQCGLPPQNEFDHDHSYDWRLTFANAEVALFRFHKDKKALKLAYVILKHLIKVHSKKRNTEYPALRTYHLKTVFLWLAEQDPEGLDYYTLEDQNGKPNPQLAKVFIRLLDRYIESVESRELWNYFIRDRNMLASTRYTETHFVMGLKLLRGFRRMPGYFMMTLFERTFMNKKSAVIASACFIVVMAVIYYLRDYFNLQSQLNKAELAKIDSELEDQYSRLQQAYIRQLAEMAGL